MLRYDRMEPVTECVSPDGHDYVEDLVMYSPIPVRIICPRCGADWAVIVFESEDGA